MDADYWLLDAVKDITQRTEPNDATFVLVPAWHMMALVEGAFTYHAPPDWFVADVALHMQSAAYTLTHAEDAGFSRAEDGALRTWPTTALFSRDLCLRRVGAFGVVDYNQINVVACWYPTTPATASLFDKAAWVGRGTSRYK